MSKLIDFIDSNFESDYNSRAYESEITSFVAEDMCEKDIDKLKDIIREEQNKKKRFLAFFTLFTFYRRKYDKKSLDELMQLSNEFSEFEIVGHIKLLKKAFDAKTTHQLYNLMLETFQLSEVSLFKTHTGILHHFCYTVVTYFEETDAIYEEISKNEEFKKYLEKAKEKIEICINDAEEYAKFYATRGRLELITQDYDDAVKSFRLAKKMEKIERDDYGLIIGGYQDYILFAKQLKQASSINQQQQKLEQGLHKMQASNFKIVSLFTAVIAFVLGNLTLISNQQFPLELMIVFNGMFFAFLGVVMMATSFIYMEDELDKQRKNNKNLLILSISLITVGILMLIFFYLIDVL